MKTSQVALLLFALCIEVFAQSDQYARGTPADLSGRKKIFIDANGDLGNWNRIIKDLEKAKLGFEIVDDASKAEIFLLFAAEDRQGQQMVIPSPSGRNLPSVITPVVTSGTGVVAVPQPEGKPRLVLYVTGEQQSRLQKHPAHKFVSEFLKVYKKGNGIK